MVMTTVWARLGNAFYFGLVLDGWVRVDDYVDGQGLVGNGQGLWAGTIGSTRMSAYRKEHHGKED
jgi:hypothetical protein